MAYLYELKKFKTNIKNCFELYHLRQASPSKPLLPQPLHVYLFFNSSPKCAITCSALIDFVRLVKKEIARLTQGKESGSKCIEIILNWY